MRFKISNHRITYRVACLLLALVLLVMPCVSVLAADSSDNEKYRKLSNLHLYEVAESCESGYSYNDINKMYVPSWNDEDCPTTLKKWYSNLANHADFKNRFAGVTSEDFCKKYRLYLITFHSSGAKVNRVFAFIMRSDIRVCMRYSDDVGLVVYFPQAARKGCLASGDDFTYAMLDVGGESSQTLSYPSSLMTFRYSDNAVVKGTTYGVMNIFNNTVVQAQNGTKDGGIVYTNIAMVDDASGVVKYIDMQDDSVTTNKGGGKKEVGEGCDSFGWDSFDCSLTPETVGDNKLYRFNARYAYSSYPKMTYSPEDYKISLRWTLSAKYTLKSGVIKDSQWSSDYAYYDLNTYKTGMNVNVAGVNFDKVSMGTVLSSFDLTTSVIEWIAALQGCDVGDIIGCSSSDLYLSVMLWKNGVGASSDVRSYKWDCKTMTKKDLTPNTKVTTSGEGTDKKVTEVVGNDEGKTVINITVNVSGGNGGNGGSGGSGGSGGDGGSGGSGGSGVDNGTSKSFWSILKAIVAFFKALLDEEGGLLPVIAAFFEFIPASFWTVVIGIVVIIAVISIYKLLKKS